MYEHFYRKGIGIVLIYYIGWAEKYEIGRYKTYVEANAAEKLHRSLPKEIREKWTDEADEVLANTFKA